MADSLFSVANQIVLVSGGSRGIGLAIARGFVDGGATVVITGRERQTLDAAARELASQGGTVHVQVCDVALPDDIRRTVDWLLDEFGKCDTLVNVAGVNRRKPALDVTVEDYDFILDINLKGAFLFSQAVGRHMVERGQGSQINIASLNTDRPLSNVMPYAVSKAGIAHLTRSLALEWGPRGVRVNAIAPGFIVTDLTRKLWSHDKMKEWGLANTPLRRLGQPEDMVGTAVFLASPAASFLTGQIIYVDGGFTCGWAWPMPSVV
jgi:NAD(P)-dependent dehydrogenase (short-subunit alcohol dehydrogenase family)